MKKSKTKSIFYGFLVVLFLVVIINCSVCSVAMNNMPESYPNPIRREDYAFYDHLQTGEKNSYSTHDWLADAVIREIRKGNTDWSWLLNNPIATTMNPAAKDWEAYGDGTYHSVRRSYITYLFCTHLPDVNTGTIYIQEENYYVKDLESRGMYDSGKWIAQTQKHGFHFEVSQVSVGGISTNVFTQVSDLQMAVIVNRLAEEAIKCYAATGTNEGETISKMKPEATAALLGAITHYFADLASPAHLFKEGYASANGIYDNEQGYHKWFEKEIDKLTRYDKEAPGPILLYFEYDSISQPYVALSPQEAITAMAYTAVAISYGMEPGKHQHDITNPESGLYVFNVADRWNWYDDLHDPQTGNYIGRENSIHADFYDKVEDLLSWSVYYTICCFKWILQQVKEQIDPDANNIAKYGSEGDEYGNPPPDDPLPTDSKGRNEKNIKLLEAVIKVIPILPLIPIIIKALRRKSGIKTLDRF